jgi:hypothetical protein
MHISLVAKQFFDSSVCNGIAGNVETEWHILLASDSGVSPCSHETHGSSFGAAEGKG